MSLPTDQTIEIDRQSYKEKLMDLIGHPPGWLLHSGLGLIGLITMLVLFISWFIRYPDIIESPVVITSKHPPIQIYSNQSGIIDSLYVHDKDTVVSGQILIYMHNTARLSDVLLWNEWLQDVTVSVEPESLPSEPPVQLSLGELHTSYSGISQKYYEWYRWKADKSAEEKIKAYRSEIQTTESLMESLAKQMALYEHELYLEDKNLLRQETLYKSGIISASEYEKTESAYLSAKRQKESIATGKLTHQMRVNQLEASIVDLTISYNNQLLTLYTTLKEISLEALSGIERWEEKYVIIAQSPGAVALSSIIQEKKFINAGEPLMSVIPSGVANQTYARALVPAAGLGRIVPEDKVIIRLDAWPHKQFGSLVSHVDHISKMPLLDKDSPNTFELTMSLPEPMTTTTGMTLSLKPEESGHARIITRDRRILTRLFDQLLQLTSINN